MTNDAHHHRGHGYFLKGDSVDGHKHITIYFKKTQDELEHTREHEVQF